jgi:hypothetical protein
MAKKMTQAQAFGLARAKWGKDAWTELRRDALVGEQRKQASADLKAHREKKPAKVPGPEHREWLKEESRLFSRVIVDRCSLGTLIRIGGVVFARGVQGHGETWEEAVDRAKLR